MAKHYRRTPKDYDGTEKTSHRLSDVMVNVLQKVQLAYRDRPDLILATWPDIIGDKLSSMTQAVSFQEGMLTVKVKNSTLHSLLNQHEKSKILMKLRQKFPNTVIKAVVFRIG